jgi:hypothetical protein
MLITVAAMALVATAFGFWAASPHSPALRGDMAAALIAARPEFNNYASLLMVSQTTRGADSMNTCCYMAAFTFRQHGSTKAIDGVRTSSFTTRSGTWAASDGASLRTLTGYTSDQIRLR